MLSQHSPT
ncbi:hypothetical protein E2C01_093970 [Portunus trituberculatus]|uniref:Uncharacterized protein n=1 Tax=Portunus trituberculatus TaxID=210409 RepID=A0A5B7JWA8_PORTR|nr:hypothetical protein [Portunus trituberculatus]